MYQFFTINLCGGSPYTPTADFEANYPISAVCCQVSGRFLYAAFSDPVLESNLIGKVRWILCQLLMQFVQFLNLWSFAILIIVRTARSRMLVVLFLMIHLLNRKYMI